MARKRRGGSGMSSGWTRVLRFCHGLDGGVRKCGEPRSGTGGGTSRTMRAHTLGTCVPRKKS
eukprot:11147862-Lingulodinium_polyedra.AAC.1